MLADRSGQKHLISGRFYIIFQFRKCVLFPALRFKKKTIYAFVIKTSELVFPSQNIINCLNKNKRYTPRDVTALTYIPFQINKQKINKPTKFLQVSNL